MKKREYEKLLKIANDEIKEWSRFKKIIKEYYEKSNKEKRNQKNPRNNN